MKKIVYFLLFALCLPIGLMAQSVDDDLDVQEVVCTADVQIKQH